ncbi:hypothetical protein wVul_1834 [Wolbachia endosymbiont of Armadillidium vulgare str. wVulC]|uniref:hypothetical protein n=1 Tax=Wolbachia endosymbiont of Armadillidium vulgare TaxID=77039 RepID=UPI0006D4C66C|nr:hypothetical protein [Wolbachia endosymbiont of Armadillidium vulgare]KLT22089.1 hypothetical protein wVul_1834 [Wolbachia endosymbiont of Armadillidium vulgare str. wVulC]OJH31000.1 Nucleopolyhedrovirus P10 protein [Wolbachia endosymbiont of Armadillidium vulgare]OJH33138.1 Nucleopolyhedrovirus P10 protein [Wolbachia endosymbiont of Armadillidium vulgare]
MVASLSFKQVDRQTDATDLADIYTIIYEDNTGNKYTFGVENGTNTFNIFKYEPNSGGEVDYSAIAKNFMTNGAVGGLLGKLTTIETATNAANLGDKVAAIKTKTDSFTADVADIKAKTDKMPADLDAELGKLAKSAELAPLAKTAELAPLVTPLAKSAELAPLVAPLAKTADVADIKAKTDKMPADLNAELTKLTTIAETLNGSPQAAAAAKTVLESSFKKAIEEAGEDGSKWLKNEIKEIVSQPSFEIPTDPNTPLSWDF